MIIPAIIIFYALALVNFTVWRNHVKTGNKRAVVFLILSIMTFIIGTLLLFVVYWIRV